MQKLDAMKFFFSVCQLKLFLFKGVIFKRLKKRIYNTKAFKTKEVRKNASSKRNEK